MAAPFEDYMITLSTEDIFRLTDDFDPNTVINYGTGALPSVVTLGGHSGLSGAKSIVLGGDSAFSFGAPVSSDAVIGYISVEHKLGDGTISYASFGTYAIFVKLTSHQESKIGIITRFRSTLNDNDTSDDIIFGWNKHTTNDYPVLTIEDNNFPGVIIQYDDTGRLPLDEMFQVVITKNTAGNGFDVYIQGSLAAVYVVQRASMAFAAYGFETGNTDYTNHIANMPILEDSTTANYLADDAPVIELKGPYWQVMSATDIQHTYEVITAPALDEVTVYPDGTHVLDTTNIQFYTARDSKLLKTALLNTTVLSTTDSSLAWMNRGDLLCSVNGSLWGRGLFVRTSKVAWSGGLTTEQYGFNALAMDDSLDYPGTYRAFSNRSDDVYSVNYPVTEHQGGTGFTSSVVDTVNDQTTYSCCVPITGPADILNVHVRSVNFITPFVFMPSGWTESSLDAVSFRIQLNVSSATINGNLSGNVKIFPANEYVVGTDPFLNAYSTALYDLTGFNALFDGLTQGTHVIEIYTDPNPTKTMKIFARTLYTIPYV